ncbi:MAG: hypothetical protein AVDCRST_MAG03-2266 [uncultured Rubrobacteraceae bacterium]|uniref:Uncharacterized protein n=1 Tax=uncultured Rubrobacteraceae bacterium TaxID=349277 RepID=A0A6J4PJ66_9ACTN|nr:MAG: hypothetical protein AVDCRST_MAG03-2266 [uncultured Rubrobacteraceae bacterium]
MRVFAPCQDDLLNRSVAELLPGRAGHPQLPRTLGTKFQKATSVQSSIPDLIVGKRGLLQG